MVLAGPWLGGSAEQKPIGSATHGRVAGHTNKRANNLSCWVTHDTKKTPKPLIEIQAAAWQLHSLAIAGMFITMNREPIHEQADEHGVNRPLFTLTEAAKATGRSKSTLRRALEANQFPHAERDGDGVWRVPLGDLLTSGFSLTRMGGKPPEQGGPIRSQATDRSMNIHEQMVELPLNEYVRLREAAVRAETMERTVAGLEIALRAIEAAPAPTVLPPAPAVVDVRTLPEPTPRTPERAITRSWWGGKKK